MEKTYIPKGKIEGEWYLVDAAGKNLGRLATKLASILIGKHKPTYTPGVLMGDHVVVINAKEISVHPTRYDTKMYYHHTLYPGGLKQISLRNQLEKHPDRVIRLAVRGMLPKNKLTKILLSNLKVYGGSEHPHQAQNPKPFE